MGMNPEIIDLVIDEIKNDKAHGASQLAREAAQLLKAAAKCSQAESTDRFLLEQREIGQRLMSVRPAMAPIYNIVSHLLNTISAKSAGMDLDSIKQLTISEVDSAVNASFQAIAQITQNPEFDSRWFKASNQEELKHIVLLAERRRD